MELNQIKDNEKNKKFLRPPGAARGIETGNMISDAYNKGGITSAAGTFLRRIPGDIAVGAKEMLVDPINNVINPWVSAAADIGKTVITGDINPKEQKPNILGTTLQNIQSPVIQTASASEPKTPALYEPAVSVKLPTINERPNSQRDSTAGKMNISTTGGTTTYDYINENPISYKLSAKDNQLKDNIAKMDAIISSGVDPATGNPITLDQINKVNQIKQQAGFLRGGTDRRPVDANGFPITTSGNTLRNISDSGRTILSKEGVAMTFPEGADQNVIDRSMAVSSENDRKAAYDRTPEGIAKINSQVEDYNAKNPVRPQRILSNSVNGLFTKENSPNMLSSERKTLNQQLLANQQSNKNTLAETASRKSNTLAEIEARQNADNAKNRIEEININSQNKLRDIQGRVALVPPDKRSEYKPMVIKVPDGMGGTREEVVVPNAEGKYVNGMVNQEAPKTPKPATTEKLLKMRSSKDPNFAAAEAEYKMRFGSLPY